LIVFVLKKCHCASRYDLDCAQNIVQNSHLKWFWYHNHVSQDPNRAYRPSMEDAHKIECPFVPDAKCVFASCLDGSCDCGDAHLHVLVRVVLLCVTAKFHLGIHQVRLWEFTMVTVVAILSISSPISYTAGLPRNCPRVIRPMRCAPRSWPWMRTWHRIVNAGNVEPRPWFV
jgi:hypothetical protein